MSDRPSNSRRSLARRLLARESLPEDPVEAGERACTALSEDFRRWVGADACRALMVRALASSRAEHPWLDRAIVDVGDDGVAVRLREAAAGQAAEEVRAATESVLANFVETLATFVGDELAQHLAMLRMPAARPDGTVEA